MQLLPAWPHGPQQGRDRGDAERQQQQQRHHAHHYVAALHQLAADQPPVELQIQPQPHHEMQAGPGRAPEPEGAAQLDELPLAPAFGQRRHQQGEQQQVQGPLAEVVGQPLYRIPPQQPGRYRIAQPEQAPQRPQMYQGPQQGDMARGQSQSHEFNLLLCPFSEPAHDLSREVVSKVKSSAGTGVCKYT
ncbi:hypothetical protein D3C78_1392690 [compost metagenome]